MFVIINHVFLLLLLAWFSMFMIGLSIGGAVYIPKGRPDWLTSTWWVLFIGCVILFFIKPMIGKYVCIGFQFIWIFMQARNFFASPTGIANYNKIFKGTHYIIPPSDKFLIPNTAHIILFTLLILSFISMLAIIITS